MDFTVNFYKNKKEYINEILAMTKKLCESENGTKTMDDNSIKNLEKILSTPLKSLSVMILNVEEFPHLMNILPT